MASVRTGGDESPSPVVAAAIVDDAEKPRRLLAAARAYPERLRGLYELPGGKIEPHEDPRQALHREIREELGTRITLLSPVPAPSEHSATAENQSDSEHQPLRKAPPTTASQRTTEVTPPLVESAADAIVRPWPILEGRVMYVWVASISEGAPLPRPTASHLHLDWVEIPKALRLPWLSSNTAIVKSIQHQLMK